MRAKADSHTSLNVQLQSVRSQLFSRGGAVTLVAIVQAADRTSLDTELEGDAIRPVKAMVDVLQTCRPQVVRGRLGQPTSSA